MALHKAAFVAACVWSGIAHAQVTNKASLTEGGLEIAQPSGGGAISGNGRFVAFVTASSQVTTPDQNGVDDVFLRDVAGGTTVRVSNGLHGAQSNGASRDPSVSRTGRYVAFSSLASNMADSDGNGQQDVFRVDLTTGEPLMVSTNAAGVVSNGTSSQPSISADGRFVAFVSTATNLSPDDTDPIADVFIKDLETGQVHLASPRSPKAPLKPHGPSRLPRMHADGSGVVFESDAADLVGADDNGVADVFQFDLATGEVRAVSVDAANKVLAAGGKRPSVSETGRYTAFETAQAIVPSDVNSTADVYVRDRLSGIHVLASFSDYTGTTLDGVASTQAALSTNGRYVAFTTSGALGNADVNTFLDVYSRDVVSGELFLISDVPGAAAADGDSQSARLNDTGARASFESAATNLVPSDGNGVLDVFHRQISPANVSGSADLAVVPYPSIFAKYRIGDPLPAPIPVTISNLSANILSNLGYAVSMTPAVPWLLLDQTFGVVTVDEGEETIQLQFDPTGLAPGIHHATLRFQNVVEPSDFAEVAVALRLSAGPADLCVTGPSNAAIQFNLGGAAPAPFSHVVGNCGAPGSTLDWALFVDPPAPWLVLDEFGGSLAQNEQQFVNAVANPTGLAPGNYETKLIYRNLDDGSDRFVCTVSLAVGQLLPDLCVDSVAPIVVDHTVGGGVTNYVFTRKVKNCGAVGSLLDWSAYPQQATGWLKVGPVYGSLWAGGETEISFRVMTQGLTPGIHKAFVNIDNTANPLDRETIGISVKVGLPPANLCVTPASPLAKTYTIGGAGPASDLVQVTNCGPVGSQLDWHVDTEPFAPWIITLPSPETIAGGAAAQNIAIVYNVAGLAPGPHASKLVFKNLSNPANKIEIPVALEVKAPVSSLCLDSSLPIVVDHIQGGAPPADVIRTVTNCGDSLSALDYAVVVTPPVSWLGIHGQFGSLESGFAKAVTFQFATAGLDPGVYETSVRFVNVADPTDSVEFAAKLTIDLPPADLVATPGSPVLVQYAVGGANPAPTFFNVANAAPIGSELDWYVETSPPVPWLAFTPKNGNVLGQQSKNVAAAVNPTGLAPGLHATTVRFVNLADPSDVATVPFTLEVVLPKADLTLVGAADVNLAYELGQPAPSPLGVTVRNVGHPASKLPVAVFTVPGSPWLSATPNTFQLDGQGANQQLLVSGVFDAAALSVGVKQTKLRFVNLSDPADFAEITVTVAVTAPQADLCIDTVLPIAATWTQGDPAPAAAARTVTNCGPSFSTLDWAVSTSPAAPWVIAVPNSGSLAAGASTLVGIAFQPAGLAPGVHATNLVFVNVDDPTDTATVPVTLTVNASLSDLCVTASPVVTSWTKGTPSPADVPFLVSNCGHSGSTLGWIAELSPPVPWLTVTPGAGQLAGAASANPSLHFQLSDSLSEGLHSTVVTIKNLADPADVATISVALGVVEPEADMDVLGGALAATYEIGFDVPAGATYTVANVGPAGSELDWQVSVLPASPWLSVTTVSGSLASGATADVAVSFDVASLQEGEYHAVLRFQNLANALDAFEFPVDLKVNDPDADLVIVDDVASISMSMLVGDAPPTATFAIANAGDENADLDYAISVVPPVGWLEVAPVAGILPFDQESVPIALTVLPVGLADGEYTTTLHVFNTEDPTDFVDLPVTLTVGNLQFVPGDRILGGFAEFDASHELEFDALKDEVVKFKVSSPSKGKLQVSVIDSLGKVMKSLVVKTGPKAVKKSIKIKATGHYRLRLEPAKSSLAPFDAKTSRKIPKTSLKAKKAGGAGSTGTLDLNIDMLPGGSMTATAKKTTPQFVSPITLTLTNALGSAFDLTAFTTTVNNGIKVTAVPCGTLGLWKFSVGGFDSNKAKAKLNVKATQPKGTATITLPGAPGP